MPDEPCWLKVMKANIGSFHDRFMNYCDADPGEPWCACMVNFVLHQCGIKGTGSAAALSFKKYGTPLDGPKVGAIAVFIWADPNHHHVSIVSDWNDTDNWVGCVGGNQSNQVKRSVYDQDYVVAYRWPPE